MFLMIQRFIVGVLLSLTLHFSAAFGVAEGDLFPKELSISGGEKAALTAQDLQGKVTVINFWATWCEACKVELKEMEESFSVLKKSDKFRFVFVSLDKEPDKAWQWVSENLKTASELKSQLFYDSDFKNAELLKVDSFPMTFIADSQGKIVKIQRGFAEGQGSTEKIKEVVTTLIN